MAYTSVSQREDASLSQCGWCRYIFNARNKRNAGLIVSGYDLDTREMLMRGVKRASFPLRSAALGHFCRAAKQSGRLLLLYLKQRDIVATEHSWLLISKTETVKGKVRRETERANGYKIKRCRKEEEKRNLKLLSFHMFSR